MHFKYYCAPDIYDCVYFSVLMHYHDLESEYIHLETNPMVLSLTSYDRTITSGAQRGADCFPAAGAIEMMQNP